MKRRGTAASKCYDQEDSKFDTHSRSSSNAQSYSSQSKSKQSLVDFNDSELCKAIEQLYCNDETGAQGQFKLPFKYRTLTSMRKILECPEVEEDAKEFRVKGMRYKGGLYSDQIDKDIVRTKILKQNAHLHADVHRVLEYYCYVKNVTFCQGMIEVMMPFLLMKSPAFDLACVYAYFKRFMASYLPNTLHTKLNGRGSTSLPYLKCTLILAETLFQYHDKELYNHLRQHKLVLEMFATHWFLTLFTRSVTDLALLYEVWEVFLFERDRYMLFYFAIALLKSQREAILQLTQFEKLLTFLTSSIKMSDHAHLATVYALAVQVRATTPVSFQMMVSGLRLFGQDSIVSNEELEALEHFKQANSDNPQCLTLQLNAKELMYTADTLLQHSRNNNKFQNLLLF
jgi:hypothetical protein